MAYVPPYIYIHIYIYRISSSLYTPDSVSLARQLTRWLSHSLKQKNTLKRGIPGKKKKRYDAKFELKVIEFAERDTNREAGRRFSVGESCGRELREGLEEGKE